MILSFPNAQSIEVGVVIRKSPGVTRWAKWAWQAVAVLPGAAQASWKVLRSENEVTDYHAADLAIDISQTALMCSPFTNTASDWGLSLAPLQALQGTSRI